MRKWTPAYEMDDMLRKEVFEKLLPHMADLLAREISGEGEDRDAGEITREEAPGGLLLQG